jgi:hypothetical protein
MLLTKDKSWTEQHRSRLLGMPEAPPVRCQFTRGSPAAQVAAARVVVVARPRDWCAGQRR